MKKIEWILAGFLALIMLAAGLQKIASSAFRDEQVEMLNVPGWFLVLVGVWEVLLAIDLVVPRLRIAGAIQTAVTMLGAGFFNLLGDTVDGTNPRAFIPLNLVLMLMALGLAWLSAGRPASIGALFDAARRQLTGQAKALGDAVT